MKWRWCFLLTWLVVCAFIAGTAGAELVLTNYTAAHPLKVLASGDSITDDSVTNGAWRSYLAKLLVTNGYVFTNLGRWASSPTAGFTQVHHEGMDGAVIAAPGLSGPTHGYAAANNYALETLADALTNMTPDLVLIDLGVNDMGRGRNPYHVATNDLSALLDLIFAKVPSAHIIVSKPTTITYSTILTPPYDTYRTNMLMFGDAVQALAAARRAQGQNVFVADLFSAVYPSSTLNSDGTHPNAIGLSAIANEMMFRIAAITTRPDSVTTPFVLGGSVWKYSDQGLDLGTNWCQTGFDDSTWSQGAGRLGYGIFGITSTVGYGPSSTNKYVTTYFRNTFVVPGNVTYTNINVRLNRVDGAVVWLNGQELYRVNLPAGAITYETMATTPVSQVGDDSNTYFPTNLPIAGLSAGTNVVAVELHKYTRTTGGITFDLELFGNGVYLPTLSVAATPGALQVGWPSNYPSFSLQTTSNLGSSDVWQFVPGPYPLSNNSFEVSIPTNGSPAQFFRLIEPGP
ncbi:MAG TPA: GDSL-type esterase/lipase family protein [Verrucomicrobiae bacterium]|jgi:lysophospholipase L1-like esterase|nr:GDSL-type esterase/lipase family protein [Verrucomicrobiae bacterium]